MLEIGFNSAEIKAIIGDQEAYLNEIESEPPLEVVYSTVGAQKVENEEYVPKQSSFIQEKPQTAEELEAKLKQRENELNNKFARESYEQTKYDNVVVCPHCGQQFKVRGLKE